MFREMRRKAQELPHGECVAVLERGTSGVLAVSGDGGYPYAVPMSYVYDDGKIYFHCATSGHKLDGIHRNHKVSFCVIDRDDVVPAKYTTRYRSVIAFGTVCVVAGEEERTAALRNLAVRYAPRQEGLQAEIDKYDSAVCILRLDIQHLSGKQSKEPV